MRSHTPPGRAVSLLGAIVMAASCTTTVTTVRTITPEDYAARSWIGHTADEVARAWGENQRKEPDGTAGYVLTYRKVLTTVTSPASSAWGGPDFGSLNDNRGPEGHLPQGGAAVDELAKFWIGADGKVYRFWFAEEIFKKRLDDPASRPVEVYGKKSP
jgi:hypothetical protein